MLSIDVGSKKVCVVEGSSRKGIVTVSSFAEIEYKEDIVENNKILNKPALAFLINEIIKTNRMRSKDAVITVNSSDIISRELKLPNVKLPSLKHIVISEMQRIIGEGDIIMDFVVGGETEDKMLSVTAYALQRSVVEGYFNLLKNLKLTPKAFDVHPNSISKLLTGATMNSEPLAGKNVMVADIGFSTVSFHGFIDGEFKFSRNETSPVREFMRDMGSLLRTDFYTEDAEKLDFSPGYKDETPGVSEACRYFSFRLSEVMQKYIQYIMTNSETKAVDYVYICGGIAAGKGLVHALAGLLKIPVEIILGVGRIQAPQGVPYWKILNAAGALIRA